MGTKQHVRLCGGTSCRGRGGRSCRGGRRCEAGGGGCQGGRCRGKGGGTGGVCSCDRIHRRRSSQGVDRRSCGRDNRRGGCTRRSVQRGNRGCRGDQGRSARARSRVICLPTTPPALMLTH